MALMVTGGRLFSCALPLEISKLRTSWKVTSVHAQVVAAVRGQLVSVFDGITQYHIGKWSTSCRGALGWPPLDVCYYGFDSAEKAVHAPFPSNSCRLKAPRVIIKVCTACVTLASPAQSLGMTRAMHMLAFASTPVPGVLDSPSSVSRVTLSLQMEAKGRAYCKSNGMWALSAVRPIAIDSDTSTGSATIVSSRAPVQKLLTSQRAPHSIEAAQCLVGSH